MTNIDCKGKVEKIVDDEDGNDAIRTTLGLLTYDSNIAEEALVLAIKYLCARLNWTNKKLESTLHIDSILLSKWLRNGKIPIQYPNIQPDIQAILHLIAIHQNLELIFTNPKNQITWLSSKNLELNAIPEELMAASIDGLICVRKYLEYARERGA